MNSNLFFSRYLPLFAVLLTLLLAVGCVRKQPEPQPEQRAIWDDPAFVRDLQHSGTKGAGGIRIVAPASGVSVENAAAAHAVARKLGLVFPEESLQPDLIPYNANSDEARLSLLVQAMRDPDTEVLWAMRGGYGSGRLLSGLARLRGSLSPKIFIGYSDMTFLHLFLQKQGWRTVHGSMFWEMNNPQKDGDNFRLLAALLAGRMNELRYKGLAPFNQAARESAQPIEGALTGGNLTCLAAAAGTAWALDTSGKILFLEDVREPGYKIDRMLTQLEAAGSLRKARAVVLGRFVGGDDNTEFALKRFADNFPKPVFRTDLFGHGAKNYPLVFNAPSLIRREDGTAGTFTLTIRADSLP